MTSTDGQPPTSPAVHPDPGDEHGPDAAEAPDEEAGPEAGQKEPEARSATRSVVEWVLVIGGALVVALLIRNFVFTTFWIPSESMEPTLVGDSGGGGRHDRVVVNRLSYRLHDVRRGDIVVFSTPPGLEATTADGHQIKDLIKRVVGLPGETVTITGGHVEVDGKRLAERYLAAGTETLPIPVTDCADSRTRFVIPQGSVLVLGDNRSHSEDGRCFGPIPKSTIVGRAFVRIWPLSELTWL